MWHKNFHSSICFSQNKWTGAEKNRNKIFSHELGFVVSHDRSYGRLVQVFSFQFPVAVDVLLRYLCLKFSGLSLCHLHAVQRAHNLNVPLCKRTLFTINRRKFSLKSVPEPREHNLKTVCCRGTQDRRFCVDMMISAGHSQIYLQL